MHSSEPIDCLVIGAGPAGLTAGIYLRRFHRRVLVVDQGDSRARKIPRSHNLPGIPGGIRGIDLLDRMRQHLGSVGGEVRSARVEALEQHDGAFVATHGGGVTTARTVLLATGVADNEPALEGTAALRERGLLRQCPVCDGYEHTGRSVAVIGQGEHGVREALFIRDFTDNVWFVAQDGNDDLDADGCHRLQMQAVRCIVGGVRKADCDDAGVKLVMNDGSEHRFDVVYAALGTRPRTELAAALGAKLDDVGNIVVDAHCATNVPGLYAAGDVVSALDQIVVAAGHAAIAATAIHNGLRARGSGR